MKMNLMVYFIGLLSVIFITTVTCSGEHVENNDIIPSGNDDQDDDVSLNGININIEERKINEGLPSSWELRKNKCGKTKQACKDAGGYCHARAKEDDCDGKLLKGKKYCTKNKKCGCCVPKVQPPCERSEGETCNLFVDYRRKWTANGVPCIYEFLGEDFYPNECNNYLGTGRDICRFFNGISTEFGDCGAGTCLFKQYFIDNHVCEKCNNVADAVAFTQNRTVKYNHVFKTDSNLGKTDWALNQQGIPQQTCIIPVYVQSWFCGQEGGIWACIDIKQCTAGGTVGGQRPGHFLLTSLCCLDA